MNNPKEQEQNPGRSSGLHSGLRPSVTSDGSTASYYELPSWARELMDLMRYKNMNASQGEMFRALYRGSEASHSDEQRQAKKILAYAVDEMVRTHFPNESMSEFRSAVFDVFEGIEKPPTDKPLTPVRRCQTCKHLSVHSSTEIHCISGSVQSVLIGQAWNECKGASWELASPFTGR